MAESFGGLAASSEVCTNEGDGGIVETYAPSENLDGREVVREGRVVWLFAAALSAGVATGLVLWVKVVGAN